jgi:hypothetical protein
MDIPPVKLDCSTGGAIARQLRVTYGNLIDGGVPEELAEILRRFDGASDLASVAGANASRGPSDQKGGERPTGIARED